VASFFDRLKGVVKQVDDKTKAARVTGAVAWNVVVPAAGPQASSYVAPPATPLQRSQQVQVGEQKDWGHSQIAQSKKENARLGEQPQPSGPDPAKPNQPRSRQSRSQGQPDRSSGQQSPPAQRTESRHSKPASRSTARSSSRPSRQVNDAERASPG
jgi:hypothetical protein